MRGKLALGALVSIVALATAGVAGATVVDTGGANGHAPQFTLSATDTTTAFAVGAWTFASDAPVHVEWSTDCFFPQNDRFGETDLFSGQSKVIFTANRFVGVPWFGWDFCSITAHYSVDFGFNPPDPPKFPDPTPIDSAVTGWLVSHD
jgi:hypothetical protein